MRSFESIARRSIEGVSIRWSILELLPLIRTRSSEVLVGEEKEEHSREGVLTAV